MTKTVLLHSVILSILCLTYGNDINSNNELDSLLDNMSDLATKQSLNVDYLPSVVTIVDAQIYRDAGIQTIAEALDMLPGIQMQLSPMGYTTTTVRGLKMPNAYLSDKIKIMIDGVVINNEVTGSSHFYMDFPMQLVERIEVLRGPNSTLYGAGAFYGTVNIITRLGNNKNENQLFVGTGSYQYRTAGLNLNTAQGEWKLFADGYYKSNNKALDIKDSQQDTQENMQDFSIGFKATNGGLELLARLKQSNSGNFYGFEGTMDPISGREQGHDNRYFFSQLAYKTAFDDYKLETKANFSHRESDMKANIKDIAGEAGRFATVGIVMNDGFYIHEKTAEENIEVEAILTLPKIKSNDILLGAGIRHVTITEDEFYSSTENAITQNRAAILAHTSYGSFRYRESRELAFWANPTTTLLPDNMDRTVGYTYMQDLISLNDDVDLILGLRADNYSDYGVQLSKRAGLVYRASDTTILKLLYGSAFRVPTLIEAYQNGHINTRAGDSTIQPEETDTYEVVGIYTPNFNHKFSLNLFYSQLKNVIDLDEFRQTTAGYQNMKQRFAKGAEFEYFYRTAREHNFYLNGTYIYAEYTLPPENYNNIIYIDQTMPDISKVMLKAMYVYRPSEKISWGTTWRYFSETTSTKLQWVTSNPTNDPTVSARHIVDETLTYRFTPNSELRLTVKNLFNTEVRLPSYYYTTKGGIEREGRNWFLSYIYNF